MMFSKPPAHDPEVERVVGEVVTGETAMVETRTDNFGLATFYEYSLVRQEGGWRIADLLQSLDAANAPAVAAAERSELLAGASADAPLEPLPPGVEPNGDALFAPGREVTRGETTTVIAARPIGALRLPSGILGVRDFGYDASDLSPLARSVPPGTYPVEVLVAFDCVAAVRVRLADGPAVAWHPASTVAGGHVVGVDGGSVAIFDARAFVELGARDKERLYRANVTRPTEQPLAHIFALGSDGDCAVTASGIGDGAYPCYWGVTADGRVTTLLVDFLVVAEFLEASATLGWTYAARDTALAAPEGVTVALREDGPSAAQLVIAGDAFKRARLLGPDGEVVLNTDELGYAQWDEERIYSWPRALQALGQADIEVTVSRGYRN
jgi:hypothetical protein